MYYIPVPLRYPGRSILDLDLITRSISISTSTTLQLKRTKGQDPKVNVKRVKNTAKRQGTKAQANDRQVFVSPND